MSLRTTFRRGYTLLEVLLAMAISVMLLGGLYVAMDLQFGLTQEGRDMVEHATLARSLFARMSSDITRSVGPKTFPPPPTTTTTGTTGTTTGTTGTTTDTSTTPPPLPPSFIGNVEGGADYLVLYVSRGMRDSGSVANGQAQAATTDLRRITYRMGMEGSEEPRGLVRQEVVLVNISDGSDPGQDVPFQALATEVRGIEFKYYDPSGGWLTSWPDGATGYDSTTMTAGFGPPMAIEIVLHIAYPPRRGATEEIIKQYRQVIPILTANAAATSSTDTTGTTTTP